MNPAGTILTAAARIAFQAAGRADFQGLDPLLPRLTQSHGPETRAWTFSLETIRWSFDPARGPAPTPEDARRAAAGGGPAAAEIVCRACAVMERVAFCTFDRARLAAWIALHATLAATAAAGGHEDRTGHGETAVSAARLWLRLLAGETTGLDAAARTLLDEAARRGAGEVVIEATVIRALAALAAGAIDEAVDLGRRAARMAQSEGLSQHEYLANVTLARIRRLSGRPHLSLHILAALERVAPRIWSGWIGWETLLAGGKGPAGDAAASPRAGEDNGDDDGAVAPSSLAQRRLRELLAAAAGGERAAFAEAAARLEQAAAAWPHLAEEAAALLAALDPERAAAPDAMDAWRSGEATGIPHGLYGVGVPEDLEPYAEAATAYVFARPGERGRRFLSAGLPLAPPGRMLARGSARSGTRTETGLAALALAGEAGMTRDAFFRSVYGFPFVAHRHRAVLDVLCHRMRNLVGDAGELLRDGGAGMAEGAGPSLALALRQPIVVPDMRCVLPTANRVLRALATLGATSASEAAERLRMPLRTVQAVLQQLVGDGACTIERDGRRVAYRIEDTTFTGLTAV